MTVPTFKNHFIVRELSVTEDKSRQYRVCLDMTPDSASDRTLVARVCEDPEFCDENACIRKCCAENEFYSYGQGCKLAVPDEPKDFYMAFAEVVKQTTKSSTFDPTKGSS